MREKLREASAENKTYPQLQRSTAMSEGLVKYSLDWFIDQDEGAQNALKHAADMTVKLKSKDRNKERSARAEATDAVKKSIDACQRAAYAAIKECDVVVSTCVGAVDPRLMACLGKREEQEDGAWRPPVNLKLGKEGRTGNETLG